MSSVGESPDRKRRVAIIGPVYPYRAGIAHCTTRLAEELSRDYEIALISFKRQFPKLFYPGGDDIDPSLLSKTPPAARFDLDVMNPLSWLREAKRLAQSRPDAVIFVWWIWVWAIPYLVIRRRLGPGTKVILQCHNVGHKEPARWKDWLTDRMLRSGDALVVHAETERRAAAERLGEALASRIVRTFLPVHEMGGSVPSREDARVRLGIDREARVALFFGHVRPFKGLDIALRAWSLLKTDASLLVAGEVWWNAGDDYRRLARELEVDSKVRFDFRFIPDDEIAAWFAACDVVLAPYRSEAQSGVALTAFHFGRPVIAASVGGFPELIEEGRNGLLVEPENPDRFAEAVDRFFRGCDRAAMEREATAAAKNLSWGRYADVFATIIGR